jgi:hypothetical protein
MMFRMRRIVRTISRAAVLAAALALAGCGTSSMWDNANSISDKFSDMMHDFNPFGAGKKPLPGERRAVFPEGVPGVQQGVPRELMRQQAGDAPVEPAAEAPPPAPRSAAKKTAKTRTQARGAQPSEAESSEPAEEEVWPPPPRR